LHDPTRSEERRRAASKAGKAKPNREIADIKARLSDLAEDVLAGKVNRSDAAVVGQLLGGMVRAIGMELKVADQLDIERRLEELEQYLEREQAAQRSGGYRRGPFSGEPLD
jgi:hypothetical protein